MIINPTLFRPLNMAVVFVLVFASYYFLEWFKAYVNMGH